MKYDDLTSIKFDQYWQGVEWAAKQNFDDEILESQISNIDTPDTKICESLRVMHDSFYPNEDHVSFEEANKILESLVSTSQPIESYLREDCLPWIWHRALFEGKKD